MLSSLKTELARRLASRVQELYGVTVEPSVEVPPRRSLGDLSFATALQLARVARKNPRVIAEELAAGLDWPAEVAAVKVEGAGYLNLYLDRRLTLARWLGEAPITPEPRAGKVVVEHTNINPNKAAHIGHLRNAVLGDVLVRTLRALGHVVEAQNYIDDTGVQLADVVVGVLDLRGMSYDQVAALPEPFDYFCWDLYSEVGRWYEGDPSRQTLRRETLHALESRQGERARLARLVGERVLVRHLATMRRLDIGYDLLTHESAILGLHFFSTAFEQLKARGAVRLEAEGKNRGCWVMPLAESEEFAGLEDPDKVIVRSDGTVTYVGKDIAYQLWKFGLLGRDFQYRFWRQEGLWQSVVEGGEEPHPPFGGAHRVVNVIDARQSYLQKIVRAGLAALGFAEEAERSVHFAYEMVALSPATARALGYLEAGEEGGKTLEMSGRKGIGVKADDLIDRLIEGARAEILKRNRDLPDADVDALARQIATAAVRFFMVKATTNRVIAFDLDEALAFEGDTGPYLQYSAVRPKNIRRKLAEAGFASRVEPAEVAALPAEVFEEDLWDLALAVAQAQEVAERAAESLELSQLARHALELCQRFNTAYNKYPLLQEPDPALRTARLAAVTLYERGLAALADLLGVPLPERM
ncbi:MAG TPA: arginine--tRNA ligase [Thermoanaerobaculia bacterium]|nr:arginine--tRNA ligase [Thermoanaerobaculia bacterium]